MKEESHAVREYFIPSESAVESLLWYGSGGCASFPNTNLLGEVYRTQNDHLSCLGFGRAALGPHQVDCSTSSGFSGSSRLIRKLLREFTKI
jgi:hypothetical protein